MRRGRIGGKVLALAILLCTISLVHTARAGDRPIIWKAATLAPKGVGYAKQVAEILAPTVKEATDGQVELKVYWGGVMGDDEDYLRKMRINQLQAAGFSAQGTVMACPEFGIVELPFLFNNYNEVDHIRETMRREMEEHTRKNGFILLLWIDQDFDKIYSVHRPYENLAQFKGARFVAWFGPIETDMLDRLNASPVPINVPEIAASVRAGVVDSLIGPAIWMVGAQMYTVLRYVNTMNIRYSPATIMLSEKAWNQTPRNLRQSLWDARIECEKRFVADTRRDNTKCLNAMIKYGLKAVEPCPAALEKIRATTLPVWSDMAGKEFPRELLVKLKEHLAQYRASLDKKNSMAGLVANDSPVKKD